MPTAAPDLNLLAVRKEAVRASKRYDLIANGDISNATDNGMNAYINEAQQYLDLHVDHPKQIRRWKGVLANAGVQIEVPGLMDVGTIAIIDDTSSPASRTDITKGIMGSEEIRTYAEKLIANMETGEPCKWALNNIGLAPTQLTDTASTFISAGIVDYTDIKFLSGTTYDFATEGIFFDKVADHAYNVDIRGKFWSPQLSSDTDKSLWTVLFPGLLALTTAYILEGRMRNTQGLRDWQNYLQPYIDRIDAMATSYELSGREMVMEG